MTEADIKVITGKQKAFFDTGYTLDVANRIKALKKLKEVIIKYEHELCLALKEDLGKSEQESIMCEIGLTISEISYMIKHVKRYAKEKRVRTPLSNFASHSYRFPSPYGNVLIISPWNYPFLLSLEPLVDALAAGNTAVIKPSAYSPATSLMVKKVIEESFPEEYVSVVLGGRAENTALLNQKFDYIFFTGSPTVGHEVMQKASVHLTPVTLELGGKSPCIVEKSANLKLAAKRIVFGKYLNCGQTCVAPDYVYCDETVKDALLLEIKKVIKEQFGEKPLDNQHYGKIINEKHFTRVKALIDYDKVVSGGTICEEELRMDPTVMDNVTWEDAVMQEEIFGPLLPVLTYNNLGEALKTVNARPHPLAFYLFTSDKKLAKQIFHKSSFGGGCLNDTIIHLATSNMGFGGVGESGMGSYHGKAGFITFSHYKSIVDKKTWLDIPLRYQPYTEDKVKMVKKFLK